MTTESDDTPHRLTTLYNGSCPVCSFEIGQYRRYCETLDAPLTWADISREDDWLLRLGLSREEAKRRLHVVDADGRLHVGLDAFIALWQRMPRYRFLARIAGARPVRPVAAWIYDRILAPALFAWNKRAGR